MEQMQLFNSNDYLDKELALKLNIKKIIEKYEDKNSWLYQDTEAMLDFIKMMILYTQL